MSNSSSPTCPRCGAKVAADATDPLCPACLISCALEAPDPAPSSPEPIEFPCEFGGYRLRGLLGRGGMGAVYDAEQIETKRRVALKMLVQQLDSPEMRERFLREGRLAAGVSHPNSLYIFGSEEVEGVPVITMEIAGGGTLKDTLKKRGPILTTEAVDAILDVIAGLEAAISAGVLTRDIKPSNCFVNPDGSVKIGDFGLSVSTLARDDSYATATGVIMGTPAYASPEQLRGDELDVRADIYSVGAAPFTLLTGKAPFEGKNAVQVVANAVNQKPKQISELRVDAPPGLDRIVARCLAKEPNGRYSDYSLLRDALLPFSSKEPEPASMKIRASAGWIDYLIAFLVPYVILMLAVGNDEFHLRLFMDRTLFSARYHILFLSCGFLYFSISEGIFSAGIGKRLKGLRVVRKNGRPPGVFRALIRIVLPFLCCEGVRIPFLLLTISATQINDMTTMEVVLYSAACSICPWFPILFAFSARRENGYSTMWDFISGTKVVMKPKGAARPSIEVAAKPESLVEGAKPFGPYRFIKEIVHGKWIVATDPVLRRQIWLLRRTSSELPLARRNLARSGRLRWLQKVQMAESGWDAFEAPRGATFSSLVKGGMHSPWGTLRHWLHDLASEMWSAAGDSTLPAELSLDHVWITAQGQAVLLDEPWPDVENPAERIPVGDLAGQQRFLNAIAAHVKSTSLPLHARPVLKNLGEGKFEKLSFLTGALQGLLYKPAEVSKGIRAGSIFMMPLYVWIMIFVGAYQGAEWLQEMIGDSVSWLAMTITILVLGGSALIQILEIPFRTSCSFATFRLAVINSKGESAGMSRLLIRWAIIWLPLLIPLAIATLLLKTDKDIAFVSAVVWILLWISAAIYTVIRPNRGMHDRLSDTWVVRQ